MENNGCWAGPFDVVVRLRALDREGYQPLTGAIGEEAAAEIERLREENKRLRQVTMACWGALAELSPCAHEECCQPQTEALDLALRMAEAELKHNVKVTGAEPASSAERPC